jgi:hypothetical protein
LEGSKKFHTREITNHQFLLGGNHKPGEVRAWMHALAEWAYNGLGQPSIVSLRSISPLILGEKKGIENTTAASHDSFSLFFIPVDLSVDPLLPDAKLLDSSYLSRSSSCVEFSFSFLCISLPPYAPPSG